MFNDKANLHSLLPRTDLIVPQFRKQVPRAALFKSSLPNNLIYDQSKVIHGLEYTKPKKPHRLNFDNYLSRDTPFVSADKCVFTPI